MRTKFSSTLRQSLICVLGFGATALLATSPASGAAPNPTTTQLAASPTTGAMGTVFTLTATVTVGGKPVTAGSVQFNNGSRALGSAQVLISGPSAGTAVLKTNSFGVGAHSVTASYSGAPSSAQSTAPSKSTPVAITITGLAPTSTSLFVLPSTTQVGTYDLTATLFAASSAIAQGTLSVDELGPSSLVSLGSAPVTTTGGYLPPQYLPQNDLEGAGAVGDLNGDGIPDLVLAMGNSPFGFLVQFGDPNHPGQFLPAITYPLSSGTGWIAIGDVNGDGLSDVVADGIGIFLNDPAHPGQLQPEQLIAEPLGFYGAPILADVNGDGVLDIAGAAGSTGGVNVYFGDPAHPGQFLAQQSLNLGVANVYSVLVADFNQDGLNDLAALTVTYDAQGQSTSVVSIFFSDPLHPGQFIAGGAYPAGGAESAFLGDFNGDGLPDILSGYTLLLNQAAHPGTFSSVPSNAPPYGIVVADLNGNGVSDLIALTGYVACPISPCGYTVPGSATVLLNSAANPGQFTASGTYTIAQYSNGDFATAVDINGDGQPDLIAIHEGTIVALGTQIGTVSLSNIVVSGNGISSLQANYSGDAHYQESSSPITPIGTSALPTTNRLTASATNVIAGTLVAFTASIQASLPTPSGSVTFYDGSTVLCTVALDADGHATCNATLGVGGHPVVAAYLGQGLYSSSTSSTANVVVNVASPQGTLTASPNPIVVLPGTGMALAGATTLQWSAPTTTTVEVHVGSPTGTLFAGGGNTGSAITGPWVTDGMVFCLQDTSGGKPLTDANTLAVLVVHVQQPAIISAGPNPIPVPPGALTGMTTIQWNYSASDLGTPSDTLEVHVGAQDGPLFASGGATGSATTGDWVTDGTTFYLQDVNSYGSFNLGTVVVHLEQQLAVFTANPNPIVTSPLGVTTLQWNAPTATSIEIHVGSPTGNLFAAGGSTGSAVTGDWVTDGMMFYLQDVSGGKPLTSTNTLAKLVLHVGTAYFSASPNPAPSVLQQGVAYGSTTFQWNAPTASAVEIHYGSPSGAVIATGGPTGFFQTGLDVTDGAAYYLQDASNPTSSSGTLAMLVVHLQQPSAPYLAANPNPAHRGIDEFGTTTILWNAPASTAVEIRVGAPDGTLFAAGGSTGSANTGAWVTNGELFYLQDVTGGKPLITANTLAVLTVLFQSN